MIFSELYSAYYNTVAAVLKAACDHPLRKGELRRIVDQKAFGESVLNIEPSIAEERWQFLKADGTTPIRHTPTMPLTLLQKRWLKAISLDPRIRLFTDNFPEMPGIDPLFTPADICVFDKYLDGDPYEDETYIRHFRMILNAIREQTPLSIDTVNRKGIVIHRTLMPQYLEYSEKDDKFRLIGTGCRYGGIINLGRIIQCQLRTKPMAFQPDKPNIIEHRTVEIEVTDERNALERVLMHFAHFEKEAERMDQNHYRIVITYEKEDETEIVIRILSFGPMVKVTSPSHFIGLVKERLIQQKSCGQ